MSFFEELKRRNVVRVALAYVLIAWVLLQAADFGLDLIDAPNWVIQSLFLLAAVGLPGVLIFSWIFEMTPEGLKREHEVDRSQSITGHTGRKLDRTIIVFLVLVIGVFAVDRFVLQKEPLRESTKTVYEDTAPAPAEAPAGPSVAVLPFENMSSDAENEYFSDGLTETLLHMLAQIPDLQVAARTSSFAFKGKDVTITEVATTLGVAHVLEGSVQKAGDRVRVTAQLIRAEDGFHVWSQNYTRPLEDIFAIQDEIATDVANALDESLLGGTQLHGVETENLTAYETYLKALEQQALFTYASLPEAESLFKESLALDSGFVDAKLGLARNYMLKRWTGLIDTDAMKEYAEPLLAQVLVSDPQNRNAQAMQLLMDADIENSQSVEERRAIVRKARDVLPLVPRESFLRALVARYVSGGGTEQDEQEGLEIIEAGLIIDPLDSTLLTEKAVMLMAMERQEDAIPVLHSADEIRPNDPFTLSVLGEAYDDMGDARNGLLYEKRASNADPRDHEIAAEVARRLYRYDLPEEGDIWADRVAALGAQTDVGRRVELERAYFNGRYEEAQHIAESMIRDQVSLRYGSFGTALFTYLRLINRDARDQEGFDFLVSVRPEIADFSTRPNDIQGGTMQFVAAQFQRSFAPVQKATNDWNMVWENLTAAFPGIVESPFNKMNNALMNGDYTQAEEIMLSEIFTRPISRYSSVNDIVDAPLFAELTSRPEVQAGLASRSREHEEVRAEIQDLLLSPEWNE